jgi:hypothetical protein
VVVVAGLTTTLVKPVTMPTVGVMVRLLTPVAFQFNVLLCPELMSGGVAVKLLITGTGTTVTLVMAVTLPAALVAVRV